MQELVNKLYNINNIEFLKKLPNNSIDNICTDVPYALCDIDALAMIQENINNKGDFLNKKWFLPSADFLQECYRVLKDGSFFITTFTPRQDLQCVFSYRLLEAGFDINFTPILWCFASGFPKSADFSKMADRRENAEKEVIGCTTLPTTLPAKYLDGLKSCQLKPAYEVVIIAQKPYKEKSKIDHALAWYNERKDLLDKGIKEEDLYLYTKNASGGVRIDKNEMFEGAMSSRIPIDMSDTNPATNPLYRYQNQHKYKQVYDNGQSTSKINNFTNSLNPPSNEGRFPATILVENNCLDVGRFMKGGGEVKNNEAKIFGLSLGKRNSPQQDSGDLSRYFSLDAWTKKNLPELYKISKKTLELQEDAEKISPFLFTSKADKGSKNAGLDGFEEKQITDNCIRTNQETARKYGANSSQKQNTNPCAKPISLYAYLVNLFTHPHDLVLDPYCGSGTTPIACVLTNRNYIGLELEKEYFDITEARVRYWKEQKELQQNKITTETLL